MANPKYADLPGIATDQPDVYETSELPESDQILTDVGDQSDCVELLAVSPSEAYKRFQDKSLDGSNVDFADSISRSRKTGYDVRSGDWEVLGEGSKEKETPQQRYNRLQHEIRELQDEVSSLKETMKEEEKEDHLSPVVFSRQVEELQKQMIDLNLIEVLGSEALSNLSDPEGAIQKKLLTQLEQFKELPRSRDSKPTKLVKQEKGAASSEVLTYELYCKPEHSRLKDTAHLAEFEQRLKRIESVIGQDDSKLALLTGQATEKSLMAAINTLYAKIHLLDPVHLEQIEARLATLQQRLQQIGEKKAQVEDADKQNKVAELYELMKRTEHMSCSLPLVVERLMGLKDLHEQALQFSKALTQLDTVQQQINSSLKTNEKLLHEIENAFSKNTENIKQNMANLDARILALQK